MDRRLAAAARRTLSGTFIKTFHVEQPLGYPQVVRFTWNTQIVNWCQTPQAVKSFHVKRKEQGDGAHSII
jgi:hypothetical protein